MCDTRTRDGTIDRGAGSYDRPEYLVDQRRGKTLRAASNARKEVVSAMTDHTRRQDGDAQVASPLGGVAAVRERDESREFFTIGELAREYGFTLRALRFYEEKGLIAPRRVGNRRLYSQRDLRRLEIIAQAKRIGLSLDEIRQILKATNDSNGDTHRQLEAALATYKARVEAIVSEQEQLRESLREARALVAELEQRLRQHS